MTDERILNIGKVLLYSEYQSFGIRTSTRITSLPQISYGLPWEWNCLSVVRSLTVARLLMRSMLSAWKERPPSLVPLHLRVYYLQSSSISVATNGGSGNLRKVKCFGLVNSTLRLHLRVNCHKSCWEYLVKVFVH